MTILSGANLRIDMTTWGYPSMTPGVLSQLEVGSDYVRLVSDIYSFAGRPPNWYADHIMIVGSGFGGFNASGVPSSGLVSAAYLHSRSLPHVARVIGLEGLNIPVDQFLTILRSPDPSVLRNALFAGDDLISGVPADTMVPGDIFGAIAGDRLLGGTGNDTISGLGGHDTLDGGSGDDLFISKAGQNLSISHIDGGPGRDAISFEGTDGAVFVDLAAGTANHDTLAGIEDAAGGAGSDNLRGSAEENHLQGGRGSDTIHGGHGADTIAGGGPGPDSYNFLRGEAGNDSLLGGSAFDDMHGNMGDDTAYGGEGDDWVVGGQDQDLLFGETGFDIVYGNLGDDVISGGEGIDWVRGGQGADSVSGDAGDDWLWGDRGDDTISGGAGADIFHSFSGAGIDQVTDFSLAQGDRVRLEAGATYVLRQVGQDAIIDMGFGDQVILVGVQASALSPGAILVG